AGVETRPQHALRALDADATEADDALGQLVALLEKLVARYGARDEADALGLGGVHVAPRQHDLERARRADGAREPVADPELGRRQPVVDARGADVPAFRRQPHAGGG